MLDAEHASLTKLGTVIVENGTVNVKGFAGANCSCRDVAALAALWAIGELQRELMRLLERPGGGQISID